MSHSQCPSETELFRFVDRDLSPEQLQRVEKHISGCSSCAKEVQSLRTLIEDLSAPLPTPLDVEEHAAQVLERLDREAPTRLRTRYSVWGAALAVAAALLLVWFGMEDVTEPPGQLAARGGPMQASLSRDVGVQLYTLLQDGTVRPLNAGERIRVGAALTAGLRNLGNEPAYLLLFAIDAKNAVHWIAPRYLDANQNPQAVVLPPTTPNASATSEAERLLPSAAVFDDLALGRLRIIALLTREAMHVSDIENLSGTELSGAKLTARFPRAELRELAIDIVR